MQHMYTTEQEAINSIINGVDFRNIRFDYFRDNQNVVLNALMYQGAESLSSASKTLRDDKEFMTTLISISPEALYYASSTIKSNIDIVLLACKKDSSVINYASKELYKMCDNKDPVKVLQAITLERNLNDNLPHNKELHPKHSKV